MVSEGEGEGKTADQIAAIMASLWKAGQRVVLATRVDGEKARRVQVVLERNTASAEVDGDPFALQLRSLATGVRYL